ncbi:helix-turn-helix domain-containing protein [Bacillaceae bacterium S4-13-58]
MEDNQKQSNPMNDLLAYSLQRANELTDYYRDKKFEERLLMAIIESIPYANAGFFFIYDEKMKKLLVKTAIGYHEESYRKTQLSPGEAISGTVYQTLESIVLNGQDPINEYMKSMTEQNLQHYKDSIIGDGFPTANICFPLLYNNKPIAILTINSFDNQAYFDNYTYEMVREVSSYYALLYGHHLLLVEQDKTKQELEITYKALRKEHTQLQRTTDLYNDLASLISKNKSIDDLMTAIYAITKTPIAFYDELLFPISSSGVSNNLRLPDNFLSIKEVQYAISVKKWQLIEGSKNSLLVLPVVGAEAVIGFLCAWIEEGSFQDGNRLLLEYSASMLGLELMRKRTIEETHRKLAGDIFEKIISGQFDEDVIKQANNLHLDEKDYYTVMICEGNQDKPSFNQYFIKESWIKWIQQTMKLSHMNGLVTQQGSDIIAFLTVPYDKTKNEARAKLKNFTDKIENIPYDVKVGIGRVYQGFINVRKSYSDARQCIEMLAKKRSGKVLRFSDGGIYRLLLDHDKDELDLFVYDHLGPLLELESKKDKELLQTLLVYVEFNRDLNQVIDKLSIHHNTLYYRIKKIESILNLSFSNHEQWFDITIACQIYRFLNE